MPLDTLPQIVIPKNPLSSTTFWTNLLAPAFLYFGTKYGLNLSPDQQMSIVTFVLLVVMPVANMLVRWLKTSGPLSFAAPMSNTQAIPADATYLVENGLSMTLLRPGRHQIDVSV